MATTETKAQRARRLDKKCRNGTATRAELMERIREIPLNLPIRKNLNETIS